MENAKKDWTFWTGWVVTALTAFPFIPSAIMKVRRTPEVIQGMAHSGFPESLIPVLAVLEILSVVLFLIPRTVVLGAILLTGYMGGAICTHLRLGEVVYLQTALGVLAWLAVYLREPRLREILPLRK